ncbi:MAG: DNRLRE domain-containing protein [Caldilineae bacterium]|nr:MAG: DNRLRE domain-containing protein [Caldilineae bacterium]
MQLQSGFWLWVMVGAALLWGQIPRRAEAQGPTPHFHVPYTSVQSQLPVPERAIFWFGQVGPTDSNYTDVRLIYNDRSLYVTLHIFDRLLFYDTGTPTPATLTDWDSASLYLNLDGATGTTPGANTYRFVGQLNHYQARDAYQTAYRGDGAGWVAASTPFTTTTGWQGGFNDTQTDNGWNITFQIPFSSLGLPGPPAERTVWGVAVAVHDRDDAAGTAIPDQPWPAGMNSTQPATWGEIAFGLPDYSPPPATPGGVVTVRQGLNGASVPDAMVGGSSTCAQAIWPNFWAQWGSLNYAGSEFINVQNQWRLGDWPCFSKYYVTFPLTSLPAGKAILSATLTMYQFGNSDPSQAQPSLIQVFTIADTWDEASITWNNAPQAMENVSRAWVDPIGPPWPNTPRRWDVSRAVAEAYAAGQPLRLALYSADNAKHSGKYFRSSDVADAAVRPTLRVAWGDGVTLALRLYLPLVVK